MCCSPDGCHCPPESISFLFTDDNRNPFGGGMLEWIYNVKNEYPKNNWHFDKTQSYDFFNEFIKPNVLIKNGLI